MVLFYKACWVITGLVSTRMLWPSPSSFLLWLGPLASIGSHAYYDLLAILTYSCRMLCHFPPGNRSTYRIISKQLKGISSPTTCSTNALPCYPPQSEYLRKMKRFPSHTLGSLPSRYLHLLQEACLSADLLHRSRMGSTVLSYMTTQQSM